jgi:hypothetical protein
MRTTKPQEFYTAAIDKAVDLASLASWCEQEGLRLISTKRGYLAIEPKTAAYNGYRERELWQQVKEAVA